MQWRILPVRELSLRCWSEEWVATDAISGDTHLLSDVAGSILYRLLAGPATTMELAEALGYSGGLKDSTLQDYLVALATSDLIEPCPI
jgi:hypothetical protein